MKLPKPKKVKVECTWKVTVNTDYFIHETSCGFMHVLKNGGIEENRYMYCPFCGGEIKEVIMKIIALEKGKN